MPVAPPPPSACQADAMRRGTCPKCSATTVKAASNGLQLGEHPQAVLRTHVEPGFRGIRRNQPVDLWTYVCTTCGYVELHLLDPAGLAFVAENWAHVAPPT